MFFKQVNNLERPGTQPPQSQLERRSRLTPVIDASLSYCAFKTMLHILSPINVWQSIKNISNETEHYFSFVSARLRKITQQDT